MVSSLRDLSKFRVILSQARSIVVVRGAAASAGSRAGGFRCAAGFWRSCQPLDPGNSPSIRELHRHQGEAIFAKPLNNIYHSVPGVASAQTGRGSSGLRLQSGASESVFKELTSGDFVVGKEFISKALRGKSELMDEALLNMAERSTVQQPGESLNKPAQSGQQSEPLAGGGSGNHSSGGGDGAAGETPANQTMTNRQKLKLFMRDYGSTVIVFHITMSLAFLGVVYLAFSAGLDMVWIIQKLGLDGEHLNAAAGASTFVIAYTVYKFLAPLRFAITFSCTPFIVRYLRRIGFLKVK